MNDATRISRAQRNLKFGIFINRVIEHPGKISKPVTRQLTKYKRQFEATVNDKVLGEVIQSNLRVLEQVELYVKARNAGDEIAEKRHLNESIRLWDEGSEITNRICEELS